MSSVRRAERRHVDQLADGLFDAAPDRLAAAIGLRGKLVGCAVLSSKALSLERLCIRASSRPPPSCKASRDKILVLPDRPDHCTPTRSA